MLASQVSNLVELLIAPEDQTEAPLTSDGKRYLQPLRM